jgi:predicted membrane protein
MSPPPLQATRYERAQRRLVAALFGDLRGSWRRRSLLLLALLLGFYAGQNLMPLWQLRLAQRPLAVLLLVLMIELAVRLRGRLAGVSPALGWKLLDNLRIGLMYAVVLEAFKLGS